MNVVSKTMFDRTSVQISKLQYLTCFGVADLGSLLVLLLIRVYIFHKCYVKLIVDLLSRCHH